MKPILHLACRLGLLVLLVCANAALAQSPSPAISSSAREQLSLDRGWLFHEGDIPFPVISGHQQSYNNAKAGTCWGAAAPDFDDSSWKQVELPSDWAVAQPFDQNANISQGYRARGLGWYRKYFRLDPADHGKHLEIQLDGIATHRTVWVTLSRNAITKASSMSFHSPTSLEVLQSAPSANLKARRAAQPLPAGRRLITCARPAISDRASAWCSCFIASQLPTDLLYSLVSVCFQRDAPAAATLVPD